MYARFAGFIVLASLLFGCNRTTAPEASEVVDRGFAYFGNRCVLKPFQSGQQYVTFPNTNFGTRVDGTVSCEKYGNGWYEYFKHKEYGQLDLHLSMRGNGLGWDESPSVRLKKDKNGVVHTETFVGGKWKAE